VSRRERFLITLLLWTVLIAAVSISGYLTLEKRSDARQKIGLLEQQLAKLGARDGDPETLKRRRENLAEQLEREEARFYRPEDMDPYQFGTHVRDLLVAEQLAIDRYQTIEVADRTLLEFSVKGSPLSLLRFLERVSTAPRYWDVSFLSINARAEAGVVQSVFRISYETIDPVDR
jgi:hypothetical protein